MVGQQVMTIQQALKGDNPRISFMGSDIVVKPGFGVFITMNPGYAGRWGLHTRSISLLTLSPPLFNCCAGAPLLVLAHPAVALQSFFTSDV